ncbi:MAG: hypothetical protein NY202_05770 [Mollicutes bacterium UO1]
MLVAIKTTRTEKKADEEVKNNYRTAEQEENPQKLADNLRNIRKNAEGREDKNNDQKLKDLENKLAQKDSNEYKKYVLGVIKDALTNNNVKKDELTQESQNDLTQLENGKISGQENIDQVKTQIIKNIGGKGAEKKLAELMKEAEESLTAKDKVKIKKAKDKLLEFIANKNIYWEEIRQKNDSKIKEMLSKLEGNASQTQTPSKFP